MAAAPGLVVLRFVLALVFMAHGANILFGFWAGPGVGPGGFAITYGQYAAFGVHFGYIVAVMSGVILFAGGLLLGLGLFTRIASAVLLLYLLVGMVEEQFQWGFFLNWTRAPEQGHGIEYSLTLAAVLIYLTMMGGGDISIDGRRDSSRAQRAAGRARLRGV